MALHHAGKSSEVIPSMCVCVVKPNKDGNPHRVKSRIVVLGNFEDHFYQHSHWYAPALKYASLHILTAEATGDKRIPPEGRLQKCFLKYFPSRQ